MTPASTAAKWPPRQVYKNRTSHSAFLLPPSLTQLERAPAEGTTSNSSQASRNHTNPTVLVKERGTLTLWATTRFTCIHLSMSYVYCFPSKMQCRNEQKETDSWAAASNSFLVNDGSQWLFFKTFLTLRISHWHGYLSKLKSRLINSCLPSTSVSYPWSKRRQKKKKPINFLKTSLCSSSLS